MTKLGTVIENVVRQVGIADGFTKLKVFDLRVCYYKPEGVLFKLVTPTKKRRLGALLKEYFFAAFLCNSRLCVKKCPFAKRK